MSEQTIDISRMRLDAQTLETRAQHLPEAMRELFIWLGSYCREECGRDIDILHERFKALNITNDKTTWSKILRGQWQTDASGNPSKNPILSEEKFVKAVKTLQADARIKEIGGRVPFVMTPTAREIFDYIDLKRAPDRVNKFGVIIGETGTQKTASIDEYCRLNNHGACVSIESPETPSMYQFVTDLAWEYGYNRKDSYVRKKMYLAETINERRTIMVENIQRLYDPRQHEKQTIFSYLQKLQETTKCTIIITLTPVFERVLLSGQNKAFFEQFVGRAGGSRNFLRLAEYPGEDDVQMIAQAFGLQNVEKHLPLLMKIVREDGRVRRLFEDLQDAKIKAEETKSKLTIDHIREVRGFDQRDAGPNS